MDKSNLVAIEPEFRKVSKILQAFNQGYMIAVKVKLSELLACPYSFNPLGRKL